jgi:hypothetical protein
MVTDKDGQKKMLADLMSSFKALNAENTKLLKNTFEAENTSRLKGNEL